MEETVERITPAEVGSILHMSAESVRAGLRQDKFPFGVAFQTNTGQWNYLIIKSKFINWLEKEKK